MVYLFVEFLCVCVCADDDDNNGDGCMDDDALLPQLDINAIYSLECCVCVCACTHSQIVACSLQTMNGIVMHALCKCSFA